MGILQRLIMNFILKMTLLENIYQKVTDESRALRNNLKYHFRHMD